MELLKFTNKNHKLDNGELAKQFGGVYTLNTPAGHACPFAQECFSKADLRTGLITDGKHTKFRCFSASQEALYPNVRKSRNRNWRLLKRAGDRDSMTKLLLLSLPAKARLVRPHVSGDFFNQAYFDAWLAVAKQRPELSIYFYTKSLRYWVRRLAQVGDGHLPGTVGNFIPTASRGGRDDFLIDKHNLRSVVVVHTWADGEELGLEIDHDDSHAQQHGPSFALLIHGPQPAGSEAAKAIAALRAQGEWGYGEMADKRRLALTVV